MVSEFPPVYVVDEDSAARRALAARIASHGPHVDTFKSVEALLERRDDLRAPASARNVEEPLCIVCDLRTPGMSGLELRRTLAESGRDIPLIAVTSRGNVAEAVDAMRAGAITVLEKPCSDERLWDSLEQAEAWRRRHRCSSRIRRKLAELSDSEREVLRLIIEGRTNKEIRDLLDLGLRTVELRRSTIMKTLGAKNVAELIRLVLESKTATPSQADAIPSATRTESGHARGKGRGPHVRKKAEPGKHRTTKST